ncbi:helix-turn-helix domain-containing protein [Erysipelothrix tonsillarum]|uniref:helix-turn-helix domain-containing protein n=1 Tax=Erysipelothrix tonsillarum TaxID=38402 RepID=UPI0039C84064
MLLDTQEHAPMKQGHQLPIHYSVDDIALSLRVSKETVRRYIRTSKLGAVKVGRDYRVTPNDLHAFMNDIHV